MARIVPAVRGMYIALTLHLLWTLGAAAVITRRQRIPASAAAWLALVFLLPVAGTLLYVLAGYRRAVPAAESCDCRGDAVEQIVARGCGTRPAPRNSVSLLHNGSNAFTALIAALQHAVRSIHMEYYIIRDDRIGRTIAEILIRKARAGLEVRVIYDAVGSWRLSRTTLRRMHDAGVRTAAFEPVRFPWFTTRVSRRNHRKIVVTDGRIAFLGGINIAKYYLDGDYMGKWRDEHLRIEGDAVKDLQRLFIADWARVTDECLDLRRYVAPHGIRQRLPIQLAWSEEGPSRLTIAEAFAAAVVRARQRVRICSPYFLPPTLILDALRLAARGGIRVEVMIPTCSDSPFSDLVSDSYVADLLDAGVELYRYDNGFLHAKLVIVDDTLASVGTANMDYRSLTDNLEVTASAQRLMVGVRGGVNFADYSFVPTRIGDTRFTPGAVRAGYDVGFVLRLNLSKHLHLQSELNYAFVNYNVLAENSGSRRIALRTERFEIPVQLGFQFGVLRLFGGALFRVTESERSSVPQLLKVRFNNGDVGVMGGLGFNVRKFFIDFRISGYPRSRVWHDFTSEGIARRVKVPHDIVYGGSLGFFF